VDDQELRLAAFVVQALELEDDPRELAPDIVALKRDRNAGISSIELDSSVGPAAFLIYHYALKRKNDKGKTGKQLFNADLRTLETAAKRDSPGPRIVAHATADEEGFILATTPSTYRALTGADATPPSPPQGDVTKLRRDSTIDLLQTLRSAEQLAQTWLSAIEADSECISDSASDQLANSLSFLEEESALALFLLDDRSIQNLLHVLNILISAARAQADNAFGSDEGGREN
jgi:hypothetical protein